jgi:hypothetical protein
MRFFLKALVGRIVFVLLVEEKSREGREVEAEVFDLRVLKNHVV